MSDPLLETKDAYYQEVNDWNARADASRSRYSSTTTSYIEQKIYRLTQRAREIVRGAEEDGGDLTVQERVTIEEILHCVSVLQAKLHDVKDNERLLAAVEEMKR